MAEPIIMIPARMASVRLPDKPMALINGVPMIVHVMKRAQEAGMGRVVVACDGEAIAKAIRDAGGEAVVTDSGLPSGSDRIAQALTRIDPGKKHDLVINVQGDMPTLDPEVIRQAVELMQNRQYDIGTVCAPIREARELTDASVVKPIIRFDGGDKKTGIATDFNRENATGEAYHHIGLYAYRREALERFVALPPSSKETSRKLEQMRALEAGMTIGITVVDTVPLGVDTPETLELARREMARRSTAVRHQV